MMVDGERYRTTDQDWANFWEEHEAQKVGQLQALLDRRKNPRLGSLPPPNVISLAASLEAARVMSGRPETDTPDDMVEALTIVLAQALSLICPCCRKYVVRDLRKRLPDILRNADRIAASLPLVPPPEHAQ